MTEEKKDGTAGARPKITVQYPHLLVNRETTLADVVRRCQEQDIELSAITFRALSNECRDATCDPEVECYLTRPMNEKELAVHIAEEQRKAGYAKWEAEVQRKRDLRTLEDLLARRERGEL